MKKYGQRLRDLRKRNGYTQEELAKTLNITRSSLAMYEQGQREPSMETQEMFADFFNVTLDYLFGHSTKSLADQLREISAAPEDIDRFVEFFKLYQKASPEIQNSPHVSQNTHEHCISEIHDHFHDHFMILYTYSAMF